MSYADKQSDEIRSAAGFVRLVAGSEADLAKLPQDKEIWQGKTRPPGVTQYPGVSW